MNLDIALKDMVQPEIGGDRFFQSSSKWVDLETSDKKLEGGHPGGRTRSEGEHSSPLEDTYFVY